MKSPKKSFTLGVPILQSRAHNLGTIEVLDAKLPRLELIA
jgi:hypothetical protein